VIKVPQSEISFFRGEDATIECIVEAYPKGVYYWEADTGLNILCIFLFVILKGFHLFLR